MKLYSVWKQPKLGVVIWKYLRLGCADITIEDVEKKDIEIKPCWVQTRL